MFEVLRLNLCENQRMSFVLEGDSIFANSGILDISRENESIIHSYLNKIAEKQFDSVK